MVPLSTRMCAASGPQPLSCPTLQFRSIAETCVAAPPLLSFGPLYLAKSVCSDTPSEQLAGRGRRAVRSQSGHAGRWPLGGRAGGSRGRLSREVGQRCLLRGHGPVPLGSLARLPPDFLQSPMRSNYDPCLPTTANSWLHSDSIQPRTPADRLPGPGRRGSRAPPRGGWNLGGGTESRFSCPPRHIQPCCHLCCCRPQQSQQGGCIRGRGASPKPSGSSEARPFLLRPPTQPSCSF